MQKALRGTRNEGFTLLELMVAIIILSIVVGIVYECFVSVTDTAAIARDNAEKLRFRQYLWRALSTDLTSVYIDPGCEQPEYQFLGTDEDGGYGPADTLRFCTSLALSGPQALPGVLKVVTYELSDEYGAEGESGLGQVSIDRTADEEEFPLKLIFRETPLMLESEDMDPDMEAAADVGRELKVPVASMDIEYYDGDLEEWVQDWDSIAQTRLPWAVHIKINFARTEEELEADMMAGIDLEESPDLDMTIALPIGMGVLDQFIDPNHRRTSESSADDLDATSGAT